MFNEGLIIVSKEPNAFLYIFIAISRFTIQFYLFNIILKYGVIENSTALDNPKFLYRK